jgi:hypothetical protein
MRTNTTAQWLDALETLVNGSSLSQVLSDLAVVCEKRVEQIRQHPQDTGTAIPWQNAAVKLDALATQFRDI